LIAATVFHARATGDAEGAILTEVEGAAFRTERRFQLDPRPLGTGFVLR
jgi:hypothetical protein